MMKRLFSLLLMLCPIVLFADDTISFTPPTSDYSVGWLADIFGVVDGVLHGTGSQIVGRMFSVFNAAVMALGGIIITYTMLVSTMNTAHEGEMLGKKWSSIWVPVRATAGFALLVPKASGYCLLQVFVMWVVVQGVGAADKLWAEALGYLNRGGVIIQAQQDPTAALLGDAPSQQLSEGAITILSGQVCMLAVERLLKNKYAAYHDTVNGAVPSKCSANNKSVGMTLFCKEGPVPSFADSVDFIAANKVTDPSQKMPSFDSTTYPFYAQLNGLCGVITWNKISNTDLANAKLTTEEMNTATNARAIAIQQMYNDLLMVAQVMIDNDPDPAFSVSNSAPTPTSGGRPPPSLTGTQQTSTTTSTSTRPSSQWATVQFGVPLISSSEECAHSGITDCTNWGSDPSNSPGEGALFNGTELVGAVLDYNGVINPTLTLLAKLKKQSTSDGNFDTGSGFIDQAKASGWIMAGSYFFQLIKLNNLNKGFSAEATKPKPDASKTYVQDYGDANSGLNGSSFSLDTFSGSFKKPTSTGTSNCNTSSYLAFCEVLGGDATELNPIFSLFTGHPSSAGSLTSSSPSHLAKSVITAVHVNAVPEVYYTNIGFTSSAASAASATSVFGYAQNALVIQLPGQPVTPPLTFSNLMHVNFNGTSFKMPNANFSCMGIDLLFTEFCLGRMLGNLIYNDIILMLFNTLTAWLESFVYGIFMNMVMIPLDAMAAIFTQGIRILDVQGINPVVALAQMGTYYINFVGKLWFAVIFTEAITRLINPFEWPLAAIMFMALPITIAWSLIMLGVGMITAYYVPLIPYMIFLFGAIAWFMAVIEAMVAAPIVALGVIHPEGHDIFGKGEAAIMILMNVFLRPAMMIIGFITAISLCYVGVWVLNAGFDRAIGFMQSGTSTCDSYKAKGMQETVHGTHDGSFIKGDDSDNQYTGVACHSRKGTDESSWQAAGTRIEADYASAVPDAGTVSGGYTQWAGVFAFMFSILIYTTIYMTLVEKAFTLISSLPDNILRWIGGQQERHGQESAAWAGDVKKGVEKAEGDTQKAMMQAGKAGMAKAPTGSKGKLEADTDVS